MYRRLVQFGVAALFVVVIYSILTEKDDDKL